MLEKGIAYRRTGVVNWDPVDQTVLANEQVIDGRGWRTGAIVEKREIPMYYLRITGLRGGTARGARRAARLARAREADAGELDRPLRGPRARVRGRGRASRCASTRRAPTRCTASPTWRSRPSTRSRSARRRATPTCRHSSPSASARASPRRCSRRWRSAACRSASTRSIRSPASSVPVWVANFVLMGYGTGAVMAVPAHDQRDWEFARRYGLRIHQVIQPADGSLVDIDAGAYVEHGRLINSGPLRRPRLRRGVRRHREVLRGERPRPAARELAAARLGHLAPALLGLPDPADPLRGVRRACRCPTTSCRSCCRRTCVPDGSGNPLNRNEAFLDVLLPEVRAAGAARDGHDGHVRGLVVVLLPLRERRQRPRDGRRARRVLAAGGPVHRRHRARHPAPAVLALLDPGDARPRPDDSSTSRSRTC